MLLERTVGGSDLPMTVEGEAPTWAKEVGARLRASRKAVDKSQAQVARTLEVSPQRWNHYETGRRPLDIELAIMFCEKYHATLDWLYRGDPGALPLDLAMKLVPAREFFRTRKAR